MPIFRLGIRLRSEKRSHSTVINRVGQDLGGGGMNSTTATGSTSTIGIGQLDLDMYESKQHDLVWRGTVSHTINPKAKPDKQEKQINKSVAKLLKNYPPPQKWALSTSAARRP